MISTPFVQCSTRCCRRDQYPNQLIPVGVGKKTLLLCQKCESSLMERLGNKDFLAGLYRKTMSAGEIHRLRSTRAREYVFSSWDYSQNNILEISA